MASTNWSIFGIGKGSLGHTLFRFVKSTQTLHFPFFFFTTILLASQFGKNTSFMVRACFSFSTSSFMASTWGLANRLGFCFLGGCKGSTFNLFTVNLVYTYTPHMGFMQRHPNSRPMTTVLSHDPHLEGSSLLESSCPCRVKVQIV